MCNIFLKAVVDGNLAEVRRLLKVNAGVAGEADDNGVTPLVLAATAGNLELVRDLLGAGADVNQGDKCDCTPLIYACQGGHLDVVCVLLDFNADPMKVTNDHTYALSVAVENCELLCAEVLLDRGVSVTHDQGSVAMPLVLACKSPECAPLIPKLLEKGADLAVTDDNGLNAYSAAILWGNRPALMALFDKDAGASCYVTGLTATHGDEICSFGSPLIVGLFYKSFDSKWSSDAEARRQALDCLAYLLKQPSILEQVNQESCTDYAGRTAVDYAVALGDREILAILLEHKVSTPSENTWPAEAEARINMVSAVMKEDIELAQSLLKSNPGLIECHMLGDDWGNIINWCVSNSQEDMLRALLPLVQPDVCSAGLQHEPRSIVARQVEEIFSDRGDMLRDQRFIGGVFACLGWCAEHKITQKFADSEGRTAVDYAVALGDREILAILLGHKVSTPSENTWPAEPEACINMVSAVMKDEIELAQCLLMSNPGLIECHMIECRMFGGDWVNIIDWCVSHSRADMLRALLPLVQPDACRQIFREELPYVLVGAVFFICRNRHELGMPVLLGDAGITNQIRVFLEGAVWKLERKNADGSNALGLLVGGMVASLSPNPNSDAAAIKFYQIILHMLIEAVCGGTHSPHLFTNRNQEWQSVLSMLERYPQINRRTYACCIAAYRESLLQQVEAWKESRVLQPQEEADFYQMILSVVKCPVTLLPVAWPAILLSSSLNNHTIDVVAVAKLRGNTCPLSNTKFTFFAGNTTLKTNQDELWGRIVERFSQVERRLLGEKENQETKRRRIGSRSTSPSQCVVPASAGVDYASGGSGMFGGRGGGSAGGGSSGGGSASSVQCQDLGKGPGSA